MYLSAALDAWSLGEVLARRAAVPDLIEGPVRKASQHMTTIDLIRRVGAMGLVLASGAWLEAQRAGTGCLSPASWQDPQCSGDSRATPVVSVCRRSVRLAMATSFNTVNAFKTGSTPLGGGGVLGVGAIDTGSAGVTGPVPADRTGVPMITLAQAGTHGGTGRTGRRSRSGATVPTIGIGPVLPNPNAANPNASAFPGQIIGGTIGNGFAGFGVAGFGIGGYGLGGVGVGGYGVSGFGVGGYGVGGYGVGGFGYPGVYGGMGGTGLSLPPTPEFGFGAYHAGNNFPGPAADMGMGAGGPADPNALPAGNAGPNAIGVPSEDPFDVAGMAGRPPRRDVRSKRCMPAAGRPIARKPEAPGVQEARSQGRGSRTETARS